MTFPTNPTNGEQYVTELGIGYKYDSTDNKWFVIGCCINTGLDHGSLTGLDDNDHPQYLIDDDFRNWSGNYYDELSGDYLNLSGDYKTLSGDYVITSGVADTALQNILEDITPQLGGDLDLNKKSMNYSGSYGSDHQYEGITTKITASGNFGSGLYVKSNGEFDCADADAEATMPCSAIWVETNKVLLQGTIRNDTWNFSPGNQVYLNTGDAGQFLSVAPSGTGKFIQRVGVTLSADSMFFNPDKTVLKLK